jgi:peptidoglycan pentaglycine glycine transferase (the first glycine)
LQVLTINDQERDLWDKEIARFNMVHPLNAFGWGKVRYVDGWEPTYYIAKDDDVVTGMMMVLTKIIPFTGLSIMYAPKGPVWEPSDQNTLKALLTRIREEGRKKKAVFIRIDPNLPEDMFHDEIDPFIKEGFIHLEHRWSFWNSPRDVYRIDLSKTQNEDELFETIDRDARRCVRKALKEGVTIRPAENMDDLHKFYDIFSGFSVGKGFMCRNYKYQKALWNEFIEKGKGRLFLAIYQGEVIGGIICLFFGRKCLAMHMGTPPQFNKLQTYYAYVWESIRSAKQIGCCWYSFRGVGTTPTQESFKRKFKPQAVALSGYYDLPLNPICYRLFNICEFEVLPRIWHMLMMIRRGYKSIVDYFCKKNPDSNK